MAPCGCGCCPYCGTCRIMPTVEVVRLSCFTKHDVAPCGCGCCPYCGTCRIMPTVEVVRLSCFTKHDVAPCGCCPYCGTCCIMATVEVVHLSGLDYCNSLLFGSTHDVISHLQRIQNYAARAILRFPNSSNITTHLKSLHWLPVKE